MSNRNLSLEDATSASEKADLVRYEPKGKVGSVRTVKGLLELQKDEITKILPRHITPDRLAKTLLLSINRQPDLLNCTQESLIESVMRAAELGLDISGTLGEAYIVPYGSQATFIPGYRGLAKLARQSGEINRLEAEVVCENDTFSYTKGTCLEINFEPLLTGDRGAPIGAYALVEFKDESFQSDWMTRDEIERVRSMSKGKNSPAWRDHWSEQARKTVFRRLSKWLPLSGEKWHLAMESDNASFEGLGGRDMAASETDITPLPA